jgi:hypothetical protein
MRRFETRRRRVCIRFPLGMARVFGALEKVLPTNAKLKRLRGKGGLETGRWLRRGLGDLETWRLGDLETWRLGDLETWRLGDLETWRLGDLETWRKGSGYDS